MSYLAAVHEWVLGRVVILGEQPLVKPRETWRCNLPLDVKEVKPFLKFLYFAQHLQNNFNICS